MRRREFIAGLGGAAVAWPLAARAQQPVLPVIGFVAGSSADAAADRVRAFRKALGETGYVEGRNVTIEYHWLEGQYDRVPALMADLVRRRVAVIATVGIRTKLQIADRKRDLAMFNLAIDSKLRGCDVVALKVEDIAPHGYAIERATVRQKKTGQPVRFEVTEQTRQAVDDYIRWADK